jgi:hypothetical protein
VYAERRDAEAVAAELYRYFDGRRVRGSWYRLTVAEVREALGRPATLEAPARARVVAAEAAAGEDPVAPRRGGRLRARTQKQLAYERRRRQERTRKQKQAARLLAQGMTQQQAARAVGVTSRTLRNWKAAPAFCHELERQHTRAAHPHTSAPSRNAKAPGRRDPADARHDRAGKPRPAAQPRRDRPPAPPSQQQTAAEAREQPPNGFRYVDRVPLWGDSDGWPRTPQEHAERDAYYTAHRDRSQLDRYDYNTVVRYGGQTAAEKRAVRQEQTRSREIARAKRRAPSDQ